MNKQKHNKMKELEEEYVILEEYVLDNESEIDCENELNRMADIKNAMPKIMNL